MDLNIYGYKVNLVTLAISFILGLLIGGFVLCSCTEIVYDKKIELSQSKLDNNLPSNNLASLFIKI